MKQVLQNPKTGATEVADVPTPLCRPGCLLIATRRSLLSAGTERMVVEFAQKNLLEKARSRPDLVRQTLDKAQRDGILTTLNAVRSRLDQPMALGYSCAGSVIEVGDGVSEFHPGDRVACGGGGYAVHAEVVSVPKNLVVKLPESVDYESAAFTTLGAIALQGVRLAEVSLGEVVAVIGLGLVGQLTVQMLKAAGCIVVGMDIQSQRAELAQQLGADAVATIAEGLSAVCRQLSGGRGADAVLIAADTKSNEPVEVAGEIARDKGVVVAVGAVGMTIPRKIYYQKELDFRVSRSYGPGRYDPEYEEKGHDYPYAYVRWTERRNMQAFVELLACGKVDVQPLITHRFPIDDAPKAYELIAGKADEPFLGVLLTYPDTPDLSSKVLLSQFPRVPGSMFQHSRVQRVRLGVVGAGNFANATLLPVLRGMKNLELVGIASARGVSARSSGDRFGFAYCATDVDEIVQDPDINVVAILTRHHLHARQVIAALESGKHVYVEKPLCLTQQELEAVAAAYQAASERAASQGSGPPTLMVGFNRRFAPFVIELKQHLQSVQEPLMLHCRVNAGFIPSDHWTQDSAEGGGRLLGEACHFIDLLIYLADSAPQRVTCIALPDSGRYSRDNLLVTLEFANGSLGTLAYVSNGDKRLGKEFLEVFGGGLSARLEDYRRLLICQGSKRLKRVARLRRDKGHRAEWEALVAYLTAQGPEPMSFAQVVRSAEVTLAAQQSLDRGEPVHFVEEQR